MEQDQETLKNHKSS